MKVLSIQQPWATLICHGIKDVENRTWKPQVIPEKILIHASKSCTVRCLEQMPLEWAQDTLNEVKFGNVPDFKEMLSGAIIGYATIEKINQKGEGSIWASAQDGEPDLYFWHLKDAYVFDEPITGVKGKLHLWEYDLDENNLPSAHKVKLFGYNNHGDGLLSVAVNSRIFDGLKENGTFEFDLDTYSQEICEGDGYELKAFSRVTFVTEDSRKRTFEITKTETIYPIDENGEPILYYSVILGVPCERMIACLTLGNEWK